MHPRATILVNRIRGCWVFGFRQSKAAAQGWVGVAPQGDHTSLALVGPGADGRPAVRWARHEPWADPTRTLQRLRRSLALHRHPRVALLQRGQYQCLSLDAPADLPREDWAAALRWQLKDAVDFAVDSAAIDVLAVPTGTSYRAQAQLIAVAAAQDQVQPLVAQGLGAGLPWTAIDIGETALRNLSTLVAPPDRAQALLHCQPQHATLVVCYQGELLSTRQMDLALIGLDSASAEARAQAYDHAGLELQRTLDGIERAFGQVSLSRLLVTPMPGAQALCDHLSPLLYVPVEPLDLGPVLDFSAVPALATDPLLLNQALCAIGAALRPN